MYTSKGKYAVVIFFLFILNNADSLEHKQRYYSTISPPLWYLLSPSEYMLREIIIKSIIPLPLDVSISYKRLLDASYYGGPIGFLNDDENIILSRGNVYRLLNGHWLLCQDGCTDCEPCTVQKNPLFTWVLQKIKQSPDSKLTRHDLQLTIVPQTNDYFHPSNLWSNYYVNVMPRRERAPTGPENHLPAIENSFSGHHRSKDSWGLTERNSYVDQDEKLRENNHATVEGNVSIEKEESIERKHGLKNMRSRHRPPLKVPEKVSEEANQLAPSLILGTDQKGQKHLVHVVPADYPTTTTPPAISFLPDHSTSLQFVEDRAIYPNDTVPKHERQTYQRILRTVFDSLNTHERSIENFFDSKLDDVNNHRLSLSMDNMKAAGFSWTNRDINRRNVNFDDASPSPFHTENQSRNRKSQQYKNRYDYNNMKNDNYYTAYYNTNPFRLFGDQTDLDKQQRRIRIKPYFINKKNISAIDSSVLPQDNYSVNVIQRSNFSNGFVINPAKRIDLDDAFIEKASNNSMELSSITTKRENKQLFSLEKRRSGDVKREFEASHHAFKIIVTTESPVIQSEHETLNRTTVLQMTTSKIFANSV